MFCSKCGKENTETAKFCVSCGNAIGQLDSTVKTPNKWKYNLWKDPNIQKKDKVLAIVYIVSTIVFPISAVVWLFVIWVIGHKLPLISKQWISIGLLLGAIGGCMAWHDAFKAQTIAVQ